MGNRKIASFLLQNLAIIIGAAVLTVALVTGMSCTAQQRARTMGGTETVNLFACQKLANVTWKGEQLWILTRPMRPGESLDVYEFKEKSSYGLVEGTVVIKEHRGRGCEATPEKIR